MKQAMIVWGGWEGHQPDIVAAYVAAQLAEDGFAATITDDVESLPRLDLAPYALIIPVWSFGISHPAAMNSILQAVQQGTGLATFHGGINWFVDNEYALMVGGHFVYHRPINNYTVEIARIDHPITAGLRAFELEDEQYYLHVDPGNHVLTTTRFGATTMPNTWVRTYGAGRVFYCSLAHTVDLLQRLEVTDLLVRGMRWASRARKE